MNATQDKWSAAYSGLVERNIGLLSKEEQQRLKESKVAMMGAGGLGGVAMEVLVRCGIGRFSVVDKDTFEPSNLNRQVLAIKDTMGRSKVDVAAERARQINPDIEVVTAEHVGEDNIDELLGGADVAVMAIDELLPCILTSRATKRLGIPLVEGWAIPFGNVRTFTAETPTLEEAYELPTVGRNVAELTPDELAECQQKILFGLGRMEGVADYYDEATREMVRQGRLSSFAPMVWFTAVMMATEAAKVILGWGELALAPQTAVYDPFRHRIPRLG